MSRKFAIFTFCTKIKQKKILFALKTNFGKTFDKTFGNKHLVTFGNKQKFGKNKLLK